MADAGKITYDEQGHPRHFSFRGATSSFTGGTAQEAAKSFLLEHADVLKIPQQVNGSLDVRAAIAPLPENESLRFESEKTLMDTKIVSYTQTMFVLPVYQAGVSVTTQNADNSVRAATSTLHYDIKAPPPSDSLASRAADAAPTGGYDELVRNAIPAADIRINRTRLMVYRYEAAKRTQNHPHDDGEAGFHREPPTLPLPPVPASITEGTHYISVEVMFSLALPEWGMLNWQAFVEVESGAVLMLRALVDGVSGLVFDRDPITKTGNAANMPNATSGVLDLLRDAITMVNLGPVNAGNQSLIGTMVKLGEFSAPTIPAPTTITPFNFAYISRTDDFAAANAYYHCDRFFRMVQDAGFPVATYFSGTAFPVLVDHRGMGTTVNAQCPGNTMGNGIGAVQFALADLTNLANPLGIAADWRVVLHELGGHGILWNHVNSPNFGFAHSAGDSVAVITNDPGTLAPDRFVSFPWVNIGRRHDRPVNGWGWGGANDVGGYSSEQILATCHFRLYRSIGGDSAYLPRKEFAARSAVYLILRGVGQLTPITNPPNALAWEQQLETADAGVWTSFNPAETHAGGAYHKVIRWAFEKQGLFRAPGDVATVEGKPPAVDVYIDDGRHGEYPFQPNHWSCTDIWNRRTSGAGGGVHEEPIVGQTNFAYVRIKNRGTQQATNVIVKGFHCLPGIGLVYPTDWIPMTTSQLNAPNLAASDSTGVVVGPFLWTPSQVGHECMFFSVSAAGDASNIDGAITGPIPEWRLVPHDNNIGQRNVHPVSSQLAQVKWEALPFWSRNHGKKPVLLGAEIKLPEWLSKLGWEFVIPQMTKERVFVQPGQLVKVAMSVVKGKPFDAKTLQKQRDHDIVVTMLHDKMPVGGMTFRITAETKVA
jgi:hypothetical protein